MGGIFARPLAIGNLLHFVVGACTLLRYAVQVPTATGVWAAGYALLALLFGAALFVSPRPDPVLARS